MKLKAAQVLPSASEMDLLDLLKIDVGGRWKFLDFFGAISAFSYGRFMDVSFSEGNLDYYDGGWTFLPLFFWGDFYIS